MDTLRVVRCLIAATVLSAAPAGAIEPTLPRQPAPSPDGRRLAFSWQGDLWLTALDPPQRTERLTADPAWDGHPVWSADGRHLAYASRRGGSLDVWVLDIGGASVPRRLTWASTDDVPVAYGAGGILFAARRDGSHLGATALYEVASDGGTPRLGVPLLGHAAAWAPDGRTLAVARGVNREWRRGYRGAGRRSVWLHRAGEPARPLDGIAGSDTGGDEDVDAPQWLDQRRLVVLASVDGQRNLYIADVATGARTALTDHHGSDPRSPRASADGRIVAYELDDGIWIVAVDAATPPRRLRIEVPADQLEPVATRSTQADEASELAVHPEGDVAALIVGHDLFVVPVVDKEVLDVLKPETVAVTATPGVEDDPVWSPDGKELWFTSDREGSLDLFRARPASGSWKDALEFTIERVTRADADDQAPRFSPDGRAVAFVRGLGDLVRIDRDGTGEVTLLRHWSEPEFVWSPDGRWLAYAIDDADFNRDVWIISADGGAPYNVSRHPDEDHSPAWSPDGKRLLWVSRRHGDGADLWSVWLTVADHERTPLEWVAHFEKTKKQAKKANKKKDSADDGKTNGDGDGKTNADDDAIVTKRDEARNADDSGDDSADDKESEGDAAITVTIDFDRLWERARSFASIEGDEATPRFTADSSRVLFTAEPNGERDLYSLRWDGKDREALTSGGAEPHAVQVLGDGKTLAYLTKKGTAARVGLDAKAGPGIPFAAHLLKDRTAVRAAAFDQAWRLLRDRFYDPVMHGVDWTALRDRYRPWALQASCDDDFEDVMAMLLGELNASHLGYRPRRDDGPQTGYLGGSFASDELPGLAVRHVLRGGPLARRDVDVRAGDRLLAVDDVNVDDGTNLYRLLEGTVERRIRLRVRSGGEDRTVVLTPISLGSVRSLLYDEWVDQRRALVDGWSDGRFGYLHIQGMNAPSFEDFERDLYAAGHGKEGLVIDVRYNGGGWTTDYLLAALTVRRHARTVPRGASGDDPAYPQGRLPLAAWTRPITVLCNEASFSNAEIFSHAVQTLGRGTLVGAPTYGGVISTGGTRLVDGAFFRLPFRGWYVGDSERNMENGGAVPDLVVAQPPEDELSAERDTQLEAAVRRFLVDIETDPRRGSW